MDRTTPRTNAVRRLLAGALLVSVAVVGAVASPQAAFAADYPTWDEVEQAKADTAAGAAAVEEIEGLIGQLEVNVAETRAEAERRTDDLMVAQQKYDDAVTKAARIQAEADASAKEAADAERNAGQVAAQLYRSGAGDLSVNLFLEAGDAKSTDALLSKLGSMNQMVERSSEVYSLAQEKQNAAAALGDQAEVAKAEREKLRIAAEEALRAAQEAQAQAEAALAESQAKKTELEAQLKFLKDAEAKTTAAYEEGERKRKEEEERRRKEEERRRREAIENGSAGGVATSGWALPASGWISGGYGPREVICENGYCSNSFHYATDLATGCWSPIYAANSGVVTYAGWSGSYGNFVKIDHGGGISTGYAHIVDGGLLVGYGQWVSAGQQIAWTGTTGASTGCHLHFEVYDGWNRIDPVPFMAARGVYLG
ncbi:peptidoglycan DD-metalloendopeptidase family protein [Agromyces sp. H3Y2-19a]|uniref:M23 family metallopeptidase n=1 Tax=Agromyces chromiiresistens TaxID=3030835 RepID=UPI0023B98464|nr:M23 family metallopeptidase [Agromyces chromiiresistens]MDF0512503.1 peptidoglycan DD-metalloendopeptidase family protein [Agromyces chromiiresistens]